MISLPGEFRLRTFREEDLASFRELMTAVQLGQWDDATLERVRPTILRDGWLVIEHGDSVVASAMAHHRPSEIHPGGGEVGWVASHPAHRGRGLGKAVICAAVGKLLDTGYRRSYLATDDFRLAAIGVYLELGFEPFMFEDSMVGRWTEVLFRLGR